MSNKNISIQKFNNDIAFARTQSCYILGPWKSFSPYDLMEKAGKITVFGTDFFLKWAKCSYINSSNRIVGMAEWYSDCGLCLELSYSLPSPFDTKYQDVDLSWIFERDEIFGPEFKIPERAVQYRVAKLESELSRVSSKVQNIKSNITIPSIE